MYSRTISRTVSTVSPLVAAMALAMPVSAQNLMLEEVVVTAQKRAQSLMDVPISVSAVSGDKMIEAGIKDLGDLTAYVPNFTKSDTSIGQILSIRGISSGINRGFEQSVVQYTDDVALTRGVLARAPFMDLERVEVLRGPQNVLFGKNSIAGALSYTTAKPRDELEGSVGVEYRDEDSAKQIDAMVSGPITDAVRGRLVVRGVDSDGYHKNNLTGADDDGARDELAVRLTLGMDFSDNIDATLKLERSTFDMDGRGDELIGGYTDPASGLDFAGLGNAFLAPAGAGSDDGLPNRRRNTNVQESSENEVDNLTFTLNWDLGGITMTSVTAYLAYDQEEYLDVDGSGFNFLVNDQFEEFEQFSQEIRFVSPGGETIDWIVGAYYQNWDLEAQVKTPLEVGGPGSALAAIGAGAVLGYDQTKDFTSESDTYAVFGQATWNISDTWRLTAGGRYTREEKDAQRSLDMTNTATGTIDPGFGAGSACATLNADLCAMVTARQLFGQDYNSLGEFDASVGGALSAGLGVQLYTHDFDEDRSESSFTPTVILEWDVTDTTMTYVNLSSGYKAGGFDFQGSLGDPDLFEFEEETVNSAEIGFKSSLAGGAAELNGAFFYVQYDDLQVSVFDGLVGFVVDNAAEAETMGVELDGRWLVTDGLTLSGSAGYLDFEFKDWPEAQCSAGLILAGKTNPDGKTCDYSGRQNIFTPEFTASLSADYRMSLTDSIDLHTVLDLNYRGSQYVDPTLDDSIREDAVTQVNARIALETGNWTLALVGKNLTDEDTYSYITETPLSGALTKAFLGANYASYTGYQEPPRTIAVQALYRF